MAKIVTLAAPVWDDASGRSIMPIEGPLMVTDERAAELVAEGLLACRPEELQEMIEDDQPD